MSLTDFNCIESESHDNICDKINNDIDDKVGGEKNRFEDSNYHINNCGNIGKVKDKITWIEKMLPINLNYTVSKNHCAIYDKSNRNISDKIGDKKLGSDDLKGYE